MIARRSFVLGGLTVSAMVPAYFGLAGSGAWTAAKRSVFNTKCAADCFNLDWSQFGYDKYYDSLFDLSRSGGLSAVATGPVIRADIS